MKTQYHEGERITCRAHSNFPIDFYVWEDITKIASEGKGLLIREGKDAESLVISGSWLRNTAMRVRCTLRVIVDGSPANDSISVRVNPGY